MNEISKKNSEGSWLIREVNFQKFRGYERKFFVYVFVKKWLTKMYKKGGMEEEKNTRIFQTQGLLYDTGME